MSCACLFSRPAYSPIARLERDQRRSQRIGPKAHYLGYKEKEMEFKCPKQGVSHLGSTDFFVASCTTQNPLENPSCQSLITLTQLAQRYQESPFRVLVNHNSLSACHWGRVQMTKANVKKKISDVFIISQRCSLC